MKMKIPRTVNVRGNRHLVKRQVPIKKMGSVGLCEWPSRVISIRDDVAFGSEMEWAIFLHELSHAFDFETGINQINHPQVQEISADSFSSFVISLQKQGVL